MKHRSVRHFGYEFKYTTNNVDPDSPLQGGIPLEYDAFIMKLVHDGYLPATRRPDQLTVNKYEPGQGVCMCAHACAEIKHVYMLTWCICVHMRVWRRSVCVANTLNYTAWNLDT